MFITNSTSLPDGMILVDKPKGISSFDVIRILRYELGVRKMGHAGTLDPLASGLLIVAIGDSTSKLADFIGLSKVYEVEVLLGVKTTTGDLDGEVLERKDVVNIPLSEIEKILETFVGKIILPVPLYSAVRVGGKRLYKIARSGGTVLEQDLPRKEMEIFSTTNKGVFKDPRGLVLKLSMKVGSGAYVRSISEELGKRLGVPATVKELRRVKVGDFDVSSARSIKI